MAGWAAAGAHCGAKSSQLSQLLSLSGSFAASGLVVAAACYSSPTAHAWTVPLTARLSDPGLPPRVEPRPIRGSGKLVQRLNSWDTVVVYPVDELLVSVWSPYYPKNLAITAVKNLVLQMLLFMESYMERVKQAEEAEGDSDGFVEDLPPIPWQDVPRRAMSALWAFLREVATATVRRILEHCAAARLQPRLAWKLLKDVKESSLRKAQRLARPQRVLRGWVSTYRAMTLSYTADFVVASVIDSCRRVHAQKVSVSAELHSAQCQAEADAAHVKRAMAPAKSPDHGNKELLPDPAAVHRAVALRVRPRSLQARLPASLAAAVRSGRLPRRVAGNALRCSSCLFASSAAAGLVASVWPGLPSVIAYNAADLAVSALLVCPGLDAWLNGRPMPRVLILLVAGSGGMAATALLLRQRKS